MPLGVPRLSPILGCIQEKGQNGVAIGQVNSPNQAALTKQEDRAGFPGAFSARALAANPQVFVCISVDVEGALAPPSTNSHGFQEGRARSPAPNSHVGPWDLRG